MRRLAGFFVACDTSASLLLMNNHDGIFRERVWTGRASMTRRRTGRHGVGVGTTTRGNLIFQGTLHGRHQNRFNRNDGKATSAT